MFPLRLALTGAVTGLALTLCATPAAADHDRVPPGRQLKTYVVKPGDTATGLAVRFHAWTAELIAHNHLGSTAGLHVGQRIEIPVVRSAVTKTKPKAVKKTVRKPAPRRTRAATPGRAHVRDVVAATARRHGVDPKLALAVAWQESGWQMHRTSHANAIGAMQVLPATGTWMELYAGRPLKLRDTRDNATAGVLLLDLLGDMTGSRRHQLAAYYQGLGAVREHGLYDDTKQYVRNVQAIKSRLDRGLPPAS